MRVDYIRIIPIRAGHWEVIVERFNFSPKTRSISSTTRWTVVITDSVAIDNYKSSEDKRIKEGKKRLVWYAKTWGVKEIVR